jgi:5-methylcytosine-specific restriction endonuclease McrA
MSTYEQRKTWPSRSKEYNKRKNDERRVYRHAHYLANKERTKLQRRVSGAKHYVRTKISELTTRSYKAKKKRLVRKLWAISYLGGKCQHCHNVVHHAAFVFHHRTPAEKEYEIGDAITYSVEKLKLELDKCDLLCANCHHVLHWTLHNPEST